jgi:branched-chain amino acid transport system ATP-binding protein
MSGDRSNDRMSDRISDRILAVDRLTMRFGGIVAINELSFAGSTR